jgi:hypothetical protein
LKGRDSRLFGNTQTKTAEKTEEVKK